LSINSWSQILEHNEIILNHFQIKCSEFFQEREKAPNSFVIKIIQKALQELFLTTAGALN